MGADVGRLRVLQGFWAVLYIMEVMAILSVLNKYQDQETAVSTLAVFAPTRFGGLCTPWAVI